MNDVSGVRRGQATGELNAVVDCLGLLQGPLGGETIERVAIDQFHGDEVHTFAVKVYAANFMDRDNVGMLERGRKTGFLLETPALLGVVETRSQQGLQRYELSVPQVCCPVDCSHAPGAQLNFDAVMP